MSIASTVMIPSLLQIEAANMSFAINGIRDPHVLDLDLMTMAQQLRNEAARSHDIVKKEPVAASSILRLASLCSAANNIEAAARPESDAR